MKRTTFVLLALAVTYTLVAQAPVWSWYIEPTIVMDNYDGYMNGGYHSSPIQLQTNNEPGDNGIYMAFHARETQMATRRAYWAYVNDLGGVTNSGFLGQNDILEGYVGVAVDFATQDPFFVWHCDNDGDNDRDVLLNCDYWHSALQPGVLSAPVVVMDPDQYAGVFSPHDTDEYIWPEVFISEAPTFELDGKRRIYVIARNRTPVYEYSRQNLLMAYTDFSTSDLENGNLQGLNWQYFTIDQLDQWYNSADTIQPHYDIQVTRAGRLAIMGYIQNPDFSLPVEDPDMFCLWNDNFGEGDWNFCSANSEQSVPQLIDPQTGQVNTTLLENYFTPNYSDHMNAAFDNEGDLHMTLAYQLVNPHIFPITCTDTMAYVRDVEFNFNVQQFTIRNVWPQGEGPDDDPYLPWDFDYDGEMDVDVNNEHIIEKGWPYGGIITEFVGHELNYTEPNNQFRITSDDDGQYIVSVWIDALKCWLSSYDPQFADWSSYYELCISVCEDNVWSQPIVLNAVEFPEMADICPNFASPAKLEVIGDNLVRLHMMFIDSFDGFFFSPDDPPNCQIYYAAMDIEIPTQAAKPDPVPAPHLDMSISPNPFNPSTTIAYSMPQAGEMELTVYNVRGQRVRTLEQGLKVAGEHTAVWNGLDDNGRPVASGVYFAKLNTQGRSVTQKMLLLK